MKQLFSICFFLFAMCYLNSTKVYSQVIDTTKAKVHSPKKATIMSACLPGLGQVYNKKYWMIPVFYIATPAFIYLGIDNNKQYLIYKKAYKYRTDTSSATVDIFENILTTEALQWEKDKFRKNRDWCIIGVSAMYILNIIEANVSANFFNYDISDDLSFRYEPIINTYSANRNTFGLRLVLTF